MDQKLTKSIQDWLNAMPAEQDIVKGATMLLQCNRNKILFNNILRQPEKLKDKLVYELRKHLAYRLDGLTLQEVVAMDKKVTTEVKKTIEQVQSGLKGQRKDHNQLPANIQLLFFEAHDLMVTMRSIHEKLKLMRTDKPCERYTFLKELIAIHDKYRDCYNRYDSYDINNPAPAAADGEATDSPTVDSEDALKVLGTYRGYVLTNISKLAELVTAGKTSKADRLREKMQARFDECKKLKVNFSPETLQQLGELGIN